MSIRVELQDRVGPVNRADVEMALAVDDERLRGAAAVERIDGIRAARAGAHVTRNVNRLQPLRCQRRRRGGESG
jgi:hypothetical protein